MPSSTRSPRRLPARVYWFRRALVLGTALAIVFAVAHVLGGSGSGDAGAQARVTAGKPTTTPTTSTPRVGPVAVGPTAAAGAGPGVLVAPDGPCAASDVTIAPVAGTAPAGRNVPLTLALSGIRPACTFEVNAHSVVAKVTSAKGKVWSTQDCPSSVTTQSVVVRSAAPTTIQITWSGRGSDSTCSRATDWALPGTYQVVAAAIGSEPSSAAIKLTAPPRPIVIKTIAPKKHKAPVTRKTASPPTPPDTGHRRVG